MTKLGIIGGLFLVASLLFNVGLACQPEVLRPYVVDLEDGKHVFVMGGGMEGIDYEQSGVYAKDVIDKPVWVWNGPFIRLGELKRSISADGRFFFMFISPRRRIIISFPYSMVAYWSKRLA